MKFLFIFIALTVSLPIAWMGIAKLILISYGGYSNVKTITRKSAQKSSMTNMWSAWMIPFAAILPIMGLFWTPAPLDFSLLTLIKHSKIIIIVIICQLAITKKVTATALKIWLYGQIFVLSSSFLMTFGFELPWSMHNRSEYIVFAESYIDQSIMFVVSAAIAWHLKNDGLWPRWMGIVLTFLFLANVAILLPGRTGYLLVILMLAFVIYWSTPKKIQLFATISIPIMLGFFLYNSSDRVQNGINRALLETRNYETAQTTDSSSGWRLNAWHRSIQAMLVSPIYGHGTGSWAIAVKKHETGDANRIFGTGNSSNPHQEFLLWGVEFGFIGLIILLGIFIALIKDVQKFTEPSRKAALSIVTFIAAAALFNSVLYDDLIGDYLCISLGLILAYGNSQNKNE